MLVPAIRPDAQVSGSRQPERQLGAWGAVTLRNRGRPESLSFGEVGNGERTHGAGTGRHAGEAEAERAVPRRYAALHAHAHFLIEAQRPAAEHHAVMERVRVSGRAPGACAQLHVLPLGFGVKGERTQAAVSTSARAANFWKKRTDWVNKLKCQLQ